MHSARRVTGLFVLTLGLGAAVLGGCSGSDAGVPERSQDPTETPGSSGSTSDKPGSSGGTSGEASSSGSSSSSSSSGASSSSGSTSGSSGSTDAGVDSGHDAGTTGTGKALGETCTQNSQCKSAECFVGGMASYCSLLCTAANAATVCVAPFSGVCNNRGYCKK